MAAAAIGLPTIVPRLDRHEVYAIWTVARAESNLAYDDWLASPSAEAYAIYRAAEDRADAAQDALAEFAEPVARPALAVAA